MRLLFLNLFRKPFRTAMTIFSVAVALFLFCFLEAVLDAFNVGVNMSDASRLIVMHKESLGFTLPFSHQPRIAQIEGVKRAAGMVWCGGPYDEPSPDGSKNEDFFAQFAVDFENYFPLFTEIKVPPEQVRDLMAEQQACMLGDKVAERIGKKIGDKIVLNRAIWSRADGTPWTFIVRAIYTSESPTFDRTMMLFHLKYLDESRAVEKGSVSIYVCGIDNPARYTEICSAIDARFENSPNETRSMTEKAFNMQFVSMMGNFQVLLRSIGSAVVLTMLLVSANTMMMSARERTREMGMLKAIGFTDRAVFFLLIGEAISITLTGAILGSGLAFFLFNFLHYNPKPDFFPVFMLPLSSLAAAFGIAIITGFLSGIVPAIQGMRMKATEALRSV